MNEWVRVQEVIETSRLDLHHISAEDLITLYENPEDFSIYKNKPYSNPHRVLIDDKGPLHWRVPQVKENPELNRWFVRWVVLRSAGEIVGSISFHGAPNSEGMIEIGLGISEFFRNNGYAREALLGMWRWVSNDPSVKILRYTVSPHNAPSVRIINTFGFHYQGQQIDEEDGPEDIYEMNREEFLDKFGALSEQRGKLS